MSRLDWVVGVIVRLMMYAATAAGILLSAFVALAAFMRYFVGAPLSYTEELVGLLFSAMVFLALPYCTWSGQHIRVTLLTDMLPPSWRRPAAVAATLFTLVFCFAFGWVSFDFAWTSYQLNARSDIGRLLLWPWMGLMPLACLFIAVATLLRARSPRGDGASGGA